MPSSLLSVSRTPMLMPDKPIDLTQQQRLDQLEADLPRQVDDLIGSIKCRFWLGEGPCPKCGLLGITEGE